MGDTSNTLPNEVVWQRDEIQSPCVQICVIHHIEGLCIGCLRTSDEVARWSSMSRAERTTIMDELPARAPRIKGKRRGGRGRRNSTGFAKHLDANK